MRIYFIRHAESKFNLKDIACNDHKKNSLTAKGKKQAEKLAKKLIDIGIDKVFISGTRRAYETILPLIRANKNIPVEKDKRLNECNFGIFGGLSLKGAEKKYPKHFKARQIDPWNVAAPNGENYRDVSLRFESFLNDLKKDAKKSRLENVVIVSHATPLKAFLVRYLGFTLKRVESTNFKNALVSIFDFKKGEIKPLQINEIL